MKPVRIIIPIIAAVILIWTIWGNVTIGVTCYTVSSHKLPAAFDHYKIAVVSDLHNKEIQKGSKKRMDLIEKEDPDIIAITGDIIDSGRMDMEAAKRVVNKLAAIAPCYYVTGNHEAWIGGQYQEVEQMLLDAGVVVLHDRAVKLNENNETIQLIGLDDPDFTDRDASVQESMLRTKLEEMNLTQEYSILLSHRPECFQAYVSANMDLVLSGHAHGGQFRVPFIGGLVAPNQGFFPKYDAGKYSKGNTTMIVSRGVGNSIIPIRFNNRPEIVVVELLCDQ